WLIQNNSNNKYKLSIVCATVIQRDLNGGVKSIFTFNIDLERLSYYLLNSFKNTNIQLCQLNNLKDALSKIVEAINQEKQSNEYSKFKLYDNSSVGYIICKKSNSELFIIYSNQRIKSFGILNIVNKNLYQVLHLSSWDVINMFLRNNLNCTSFYGQLLGCSMVFKITMYWMGKYVVLNFFELPYVNINPDP